MANPLPSLPELFDVDYGDFAEDLDFYRQLAKRTDGPVLELGVGTGRVAIPLAADGTDVWGIDDDDAMLEQAQANGGAQGVHGIRLERADMRDFTLDQSFGLIYAGMGAFHHLLTRDDQRACLRCVAEHLSPDGIFVCDLRPLLFEDWETGEAAPLLHDWTRYVADFDATVTKLRTESADADSQIKRITVFYDVSPTGGPLHRITKEVDLRFTTRYEMEELLHSAGLIVDQMYGDFDLSPFDGDSEYMITVARHDGKESE